MHRKKYFFLFLLEFTDSGVLEIPEDHFIGLSPPRINIPYIYVLFLTNNCSLGVFASIDLDLPTFAERPAPFYSCHKLCSLW